MNLTQQFKEKLELLKTKLENTSSSYKYSAELILSGLKTIDLKDPIRNIFAKHGFTNEESFARLKSLTNELSTFYKHEEIILTDDKRIRKALQLLEALEDKVSDLLTALQARIIFLENLKKE